MSQVDSDEIAVIISPERPPLDEPIDIRVTGLTPDEQVTLRVEMSWDDRTFASQATFNANAGGVVDPGETAPLAGSYDGVKKMGLFWSLAPVDEESERSELPARLPTTVTVEQDGDVMASAQFDRIGSEGVRRQEVDASGVPADLYLHKARDRIQV